LRRHKAIYTVIYIYIYGVACDARCDEISRGLISFRLIIWFIVIKRIEYTDVIKNFKKLVIAKKKILILLVYFT
jgi:hypothetical protein